MTITRPALYLVPPPSEIWVGVGTGEGPLWAEGRSWQEWLAAGGASPGTVRLRSHYVAEFGRLHADPWAVTGDDVVAYLVRSDWAPETRKSAGTSLRSFYRWAVATGRTELDPTATVPKVHVPAGVPRPAPEVVLLDALARANREDRLILLLGAYAGLRRSEIAGLRCSDVDGQAIRVSGKGGRVRLVPLHPILQDEFPCDHGDTWVFPSPVRQGEHVCPDYVADRAQRLLGDGWTTHTLRHRFATQAYRGSRDLRAVQTLLGHSKPETTARYVAVVQDDLTAAVAAIA